MENGQLNWIAGAERGIARIHECRTRLIPDVVTDKVDVRHLAPSEQVPGDETGQAEDLAEGIDEEGMPGEDEPEPLEEASER